MQHGLINLEFLPVKNALKPRTFSNFLSSSDEFARLIHSISFSPDGNYLGLGLTDKTARIIHLASGEEVHRFEGHAELVKAVAFSPDGMLFATASWDYTLSLWDMKTGQEQAMFEGHDGKVTSVAFTRDGLLLVSGSTDGTVRVWNVATGTERSCLVKEPFAPHLKELHRIRVRLH